MGPDVERRLLRAAVEMAKRSSDPSSKFGAILTDPEGRVLGVGFNGFPDGIEEDERMNDRPTKYELVVHAEMRAMLDAVSRRYPLAGTVLFVSTVPCCRCAVHIIEAGIARVVSERPTPDYCSRWGDSIQRTIGLFREAEVQFSMGENDGK